MSEYDRLAAQADTLIHKASPNWTGTLGINTRAHVASGLYEDFLPQLSGQQGYRTLREMVDNDATIGSILYAIEMLLREVPWEAEPDNETEDDRGAVFLDEATQDMEHTWPDFIAKAVSFLPFGFSLFEQQWRRRTPTEGSRYTDGRFGWRQFAVRPQESIIRFGPDTVTQSTGHGYVEIPKAKLVHFQTDSTVPWGRPILRTAYPSYYMKKRVTEFMVIGMERDLAGMPIAWIPAENLIAKDTVYQAWKDIVTRTKKDELWGWLLPQELDEQGNKLYEFEVVRGSGPAAVDPVRVIRMFAMDIATTVLAEFVGLGRDTVGSRALAEPKQELFQTTLEAWADVMESTINRQAVDPLLKANGLPAARLRHGPVKDANLADLGMFIRDTAGAGMEWFTVPDDNVTDRVRQLAGFDAAPADPDSPDVTKLWRP